MAGFHSPIEQFEIHTYSKPLFELGGHPIAMTNFSVAMIVAAILPVLFMTLTMRREAVVPTRWQVLGETFYNAIENTLLEAAGNKAKPYMPFIFTVFMFILAANLIGLVPHVYTVTSQIVVNFALAFTVILAVIGIGFAKHGLHFLTLFVPKGVPMALLPFLTVMELVSFFIRPCSLSLRLFGNMLAGHILLKVFASMAAAIADQGVLAAAGIFPIVMDIAIVAFEVFVALLQAFIFTVLSSVYLRDALELH